MARSLTSCRHRFDLLGADHAGQDRVDGHSGRGHLQRKGADHAEQAGFRRRVGDLAAEAVGGGDRGDRDHPARAALPHPGQRRLQGEERAGQVDLEFGAATPRDPSSPRVRGGRRRRRWRPPRRPVPVRPRSARTPPVASTSRTSKARLIASPPRSGRPTVSSAPFRSQAATFHPCAASSRQVARPIPPAAPVTSARSTSSARSNPYRSPELIRHSAASLYQYQTHGS